MSRSIEVAVPQQSFEAVKRMKKFKALPGIDVFESKSSMTTPKTVALNVSGTTFEVARATIDRLPTSYLARLVANNECMNGEPLFVDRDADLFRVVLNFYRTGEVDVPPTVALAALEREFDFFCLDIESESVHVQNVGEDWHRRIIPMWTHRLTRYFARMFESAWFMGKTQEFLEFNAVCGPPRERWPGNRLSPQEAQDPQKWFECKTARTLAIQLMRDRFNVNARWFAVLVPEHGGVQVDYPEKALLNGSNRNGSNRKIWGLTFYCRLEERSLKRKRRGSEASP